MSRSAHVTQFLIVVNVIVFLWELAIAGPGLIGGNPSNPEALYNAGALVPIAVTQYHEYWRIVTGAFMHASLLHIGFNMFALWIFGRFVEAAVGGPRMFLIYAVSLLASGLSVVAFSPPDVATLGASGAIFGLIGALFAIGFKFGKRGADLIRANLPMLILNLIFTFTFPGISWQAHVGGLIAGFILTFVIYFPPRRVRPEVFDPAAGTVLDTEYESPSENVTPHTS
ncbi:MAG: rhomboid family intramembrane serine protease [Candidatus Tyrphobacter sp.]